MDANDLLGPVFSTLLVILLGMMVYTTYILARRPLVLNLREIYFFHNRAFTRAWYLVIAGMTMFLMARVVLEGERLGVMAPPPGIAELFLVLFGIFVFMAFFAILLVFQRYMPSVGAADEDIEDRLRAAVRDAVLRQDDDEGITFTMSQAEDIYRGRPSLGPHVHLAHYRGVVLGMTRYLERRFGQLGDALLYTVGRQTGRAAAQHMKVENPEPDAALGQFLLELRTALVGIPTITDRSPTRVRIRFEECALCSGIQPPNRTAQCHYLTGLFRGLFEVLSGPHVKAVESECCAKGDPACVIDVQLPGEPLQAQNT